MKFEDDIRMLHELLTMANVYRARGRCDQADELMNLVSSIRTRLSNANVDPQIKAMLHLSDDEGFEDENQRA